MSKINRLEEVFADHKIYNRAIAKYLSVTEPTVSRWIHNKQQPDIYTFYKIAEYLKIDIRDLFHPTKWDE